MKLAGDWLERGEAERLTSQVETGKELVVVLLVGRNGIFDFTTELLCA